MFLERDVKHIRRDCRLPVPGERGKESGIPYLVMTRFDPKDNLSSTLVVAYPYHEYMEDGSDWVTFRPAGYNAVLYVYGMEPYYETDHCGLVMGWARLQEVDQKFQDFLDELGIVFEPL